MVLAPCPACASDSSTPFDDAFDAAADVPYLSSLSVRRDGVVVREAYFLHTSATTPHDVRSVTKTVTALLIGAAIDAGCITSVDQPIGELLGDHAPSEPAKAAITVRDLLTMTSGLDWFEDGALGYNQWIQAPDQVAYALAPALVAPPGTMFNYNSGALHVLSAILSHACVPTRAFADQHLFGPLGIASPGWEIDNQGLANGAAGVRLTNPQLAEIGQLILDRGAHDGVQLVAAAYVDEMIAPQASTCYPSNGTPEYGFGIWLGDKPPIGSFALAEGFGGQFIAVVPSARAVVVATTNWQGLGAQAGTDFRQLYDVLVAKLLPAL